MSLLDFLKKKDKSTNDFDIMLEVNYKRGNKNLSAAYLKAMQDETDEAVKAVKKKYSNK